MPTGNRPPNRFIFPLVIAAGTTSTISRVKQVVFDTSLHPCYSGTNESVVTSQWVVTLPPPKLEPRSRIVGASFSGRSFLECATYRNVLSPGHRRGFFYHRQALAHEYSRGRDRPPHGDEAARARRGAADPGEHRQVAGLAAQRLRLAAAANFISHACNALYHIVKAEVGPETTTALAVRPLAAHDGKFVVKYFLLRKAARPDARGHEGSQRATVKKD